MKFLTVLAVLAMAFAAFAVIAPAEQNDADILLPTTGFVPLEDGATISTLGVDSTYFVNSDIKLNVEVAADFNGTEAGTGADSICIAVLDGCSVEFTVASDAKMPNILLWVAKTATLSDDTYTITVDSTAIADRDGRLWMAAGDVATMTAAVESSNGIIYLGPVSYELNVDGKTSYVTGTWGTSNYIYLKTNTSAIIIAKDLTATVKSQEDGSVVKVSDFTGQISYKDATNLQLDSWTAGNIEITGGTLTQKASTAITIASTSALTIGSSGTYTTGENTFTNNGVIIANGLLDASSATFTNTGKLTIAGTAGVKGTITNNGTITAKTTATAFTNTPVIDPASTGKIINTTNAEATISGTLSTSTTTFYKNQTVTVTDDLVINQSLIVEGMIVIPEGVTVTINGTAGSLKVLGIWASIQNYGTITVENSISTTGSLIIDGATFDNYGTLEIRRTTGTSTDPTLVIGDGTDYTVMNNSGMFIDEVGVVSLAAKAQLNNKTSGYIEIQGDFQIADGIQAFTNAGQIKAIGTFTNAGAATIQMTGNGATFEAVSMSVVNATLTISNVMTSTLDGYVYTGTATAAFAVTTADNVYQGLKITSGWYKSSSKYYRSLDLSGTINVTTTAGVAAAGLDVTVASTAGTGFITVLDELSIPSLADLAMNTATLIVKGDVTVGQAGGIISFTGTNTVTVSSGSITSPVISPTTLNAAYFSKVNTLGTLYYYMPLKNAIAGAIEAGVSKVYASGTTTVSSDMEIPAGIAVTNNGTLTISNGYVLTVKDGASLTNNGTVTVKGTLYAEVAKTGIKGTEPVADVKQKGAVDVTYTNLAYAINNAREGDVIIITKDSGVTISDNLTIPAGIMVDTNDKNLTLTEGKTLTVNGILLIDGGVYTSNGCDVVVNGYLITDKVVSYSAGWPAGAYYNLTMDNLDYYGICGLSKIGTVVASDEVYTFNVYGDAKTSLISATGTSSDSVSVIFHNDVDVSDMEFIYGGATFAAGTDVKTEITNGSGSVRIYATMDAISYVGDYEGLSATLYTNYSTDVPAKKYDVTFDGNVQISGTIPNAAIKGDAVVKGTSSSPSTATLNGATVEGTLTVDYYATVYADDIYIVGELTVNDEDTSKTAGVFNLSERMFIGDVEFDDSTAAAASVTGNVVVGNSAAIIVVAGNSVDEEIVAGLKSTTISVDGVLWLTIYGNSTVDLSNLAIPVVNGKAVTFLEEDDIADNGGFYIPDETEITVGDQESYDISVNYYIYNIMIITDAGVKSVAIDGVELLNTYSSNAYETVNPILAGTHTVTYTLKSGYEGTPSLYTETHTILKDMKFVVDGTDSERLDDQGEYYVFTFELSGTDPIPEPEPVVPEEEQWTITTILLVILVILIAIMAVIVALRLNRS